MACLAEPTSVSDVAARTRLSQSLVSHHLRLLRAARILRGGRRGKQVFYSAADAHVRKPHKIERQGSMFLATVNS